MTKTVIVILLLCLAGHAEVLKNIEYATIGDVILTLDASIPDGPGPFPGVILVHGGSFVAGDKEEYINYIFKPLTDARFAWFSINYRLAPKYKFPAAIDDLERAIQYVRNNAAKYKVDPKRIALIGESAGGHLVSYIAARNLPESQVAAVVSFYGIHDFISRAVVTGPKPSEALRDFLGVNEVTADSAPLLASESISPELRKKRHPAVPADSWQPRRRSTLSAVVGDVRQDQRSRRSL